MFPNWLHILSWVALSIGGLSGILIATDVAPHPQHMGVMNVVWPTTAFSAAHSRSGSTSVRTPGDAGQDAGGDATARETA